MIKEESTTSIKRHISQRFGFMQSKIVLLEGSFRAGRCTSCAFAVCGFGYTTDFETFERSEAYDCKEADND